MAEPQVSAAEFDNIFDTLKKGGAADPESSASATLLELERMRQDREDRRAREDREARREERLEAAKAESNKMMIQLAGLILPAVLNKGTDPVLISLLSNKGGTEELKSLLEMQRQAASEQLKLSQVGFLEIMKTKDALNAELLQQALDRRAEGDGEEEGGFAGTLREITRAAETFGPMLRGAPVVPAVEAPVDGAPAGTAPAPAAAKVNAPRQAAKPKAIPSVVLHQLRQMQEGTAKGKPALLRSALVTVILQDDKLTAALLSEKEDEVFGYCLPFVQEDEVLANWIRQPATVPWLANYIGEVIVPLLQDMTEEDEEDEEPETLSPESVAKDTKQPTHVKAPTKPATPPNPPAAT